MSDINEHSIIGKTDQTRSRPYALLQEQSIFCQRAIRIRCGLVPKTPAKNEGPAMDVLYEQTLMQFRRAFPELPSAQIEEDLRGETGYIGAPANERRQLNGKPPGIVPVIVVPMRDEFAPSERARFVPLDADTGASGQTDVPNGRIRR